MRLRIHGRRSALLALCPLASSVAAALFSDATRQLLRNGNANAIHGCKSHLVSNSMVTMTSERIIEQVSERVGVRKRPPLRRMSDVRMRCFLIPIMLMHQILAYCWLVNHQYILPFWDLMRDRRVLRRQQRGLRPPSRESTPDVKTNQKKPVPVKTSEGARELAVRTFANRSQLCIWPSNPLPVNSTLCLNIPGLEKKLLCLLGSARLLRT